MTEYKAPTRLWRPEGFVADDWVLLGEGEVLPVNRNVILPLAAYLALSQEDRADTAGRIGVQLSPEDDLDAILPFLPELPMIALDFPVFGDGRSYSKAASLRGRHDYHGILRATGEILIDQAELMLRSGFDELLVSHEVTIARLEAGKTGGIPFHTQPSQKAETTSQDYSWRRLPAA